MKQSSSKFFLIPRVKGLKDTVSICTDKKAEDIVIMDMRKLCSFTEYFILASGESTVQIKAILNEIVKNFKKKKVRINHVEGRKEGRWVILDAGRFVVHLFTKELREFYNLELLWADVPKLSLSAK